MTAALITVSGVLLAAIGYSIWSRIRIAKLFRKIEETSQARDEAIRDVELNLINLKTAEATLEAMKLAKQKSDLAAIRLRGELNDVLDLVAKGQLSNAEAVRAKLSDLLSS